MNRFLLSFLLGWALLPANGSAADSPLNNSVEKLELKSGDHIAIIGNTLADRFQHSGWLETFIYAKYPNHDLVFRNLAVAGDEVGVRHRPADFGSQDEWLKKVGADVIFAFFGFNESFAGAAGLPKFRADLTKFIKAASEQNYSGKGHPRIVLFSPIANEKHPDPNYPDPAANNANIKQYVEAMRDVAQANHVQFVDLFQPSVQLFADAARQKRALTINGMHLTESGDEIIARVIYRVLFGEETKVNLVASDPPGQMAKLRLAVNEKNEQWHARYRTIDGNNVYGGRSELAYQPEKGGFINNRNAAAPYVSNFKVMQEEMSQRDVMTANRDKRIWAVAKGGDLKVDDSNLPAVAKVKSNLPGPNTDESFPFIGGQEAITKMTVHSGMKVNLFASEEQFPELAKPVQMAWDTKGRLWVAVWPNYPERTPDSKVGDSLLIFEDTNGDGKADKCTHFVGDLNAPTGFQFYKDGVLVMEAPDLWFVRDSNGDGKADTLERVLMGLSSADSHHTANAICLDPGGAMYLSDGVFHRTQVETANGPVRNNDAAIYRFEPRTGKFETYVSYNFANPHGRVFDYWGNDLITDGTGNNTYYGPAFSGHIDYPAKHEGMKEFWNRPSRPCAGTTILTSRHFPAEFQGNFLNCNVIGFQGIYRVKVTEDGSGLKGETLENLVSSSDHNFRPVAVDLGPDGAIYFADWQNPIIGHMQHHLRDPNRDHDHGRIYRITYDGRPLLKTSKIDGAPIPALLALLEEPENQIREWAKIELGKRDSSQVIAAIKDWTAKLDKSDPAYEHHLMEALWIHQWHNVVNGDLLKRMLQSPEPRARAAAGRVLCYWRDRVPGALESFKKLAADENPRVRLEAVRGTSFFKSVEAVDVALAILKHPTDYYLDYTLSETLRQLEPVWRRAIETGKPIATDNPAGSQFLLRTISTSDLLKLPRSAMVLEALIARADALDADRMVALGELSKMRKTDQVTVLLSEIEEAGNSSDISGPRPRRRGRVARPMPGDEPKAGAVKATVARLLPYQRPEFLKPQRARIEALTDAAPAVRPAAWAALALADESFDAIWREAGQSPDRLADLLNGIPLLPEADFRAQAYARVKPLLDEKPAAFAGFQPAAAKDVISSVRRGAIRALVSMNHEPAAVFAALTSLINRGDEVAPAAHGLRVISRPKWPQAEAGIAANALVSWAKTIPASDRTSSDYCEIVQLAGDLTAALPAEKASALRKTLKELRVSLYVIRTVREQMRYDTPRLVVETGKPFEIRFENDDFMPHNLVIVKPNTREAVGVAAAPMKPDELDSEGRAFIPKTTDILGATKLLQAGEQQSLKLMAPSVEGEYEYFCTYPGHYQVMWARLIITKDVDAYLLAHPEAPLPTASQTTAAEDGAKGATHAHSHSGNELQ